MTKLDIGGTGEDDEYDGNNDGSDDFPTFDDECYDDVGSTGEDDEYDGNDDTAATMAR